MGKFDGPAAADTSSLSAWNRGSAASVPEAVLPANSVLQSSSLATGLGM